MAGTARVLRLEIRRPGIETAVVTDVEPTAGRVGLALDACGTTVRARVALGDSVALRPGDRVLTISQEGSETFVIGVLERAQTVEEQDRELQLAGGTRVLASNEAEVPNLRVLAPDGRLLFEYDERTGKARLYAAEGDAEFVAPKGGIAFRAASSIRLEAPHVSIAAQSRVDLNVSGDGGLSASTFRLDPFRSRWSASQIDLTGRRGRVTIEDMELTGLKATARLGRARLVVGRLETIAETVVEQARNVYRTVKELSQLRTGRLRTLVDGTYHVTSGRTIIKAKEDVKIDGEQIDLG